MCCRRRCSGARRRSTPRSRPPTCSCSKSPWIASQKADIQAFIKDNGFLPPGTALPSLLNADAREDYIAALNLTHVPADKLTQMRPWLALLMLEGGMVTQQHFSADSGLDRQIYALALKRPGAAFRAFETPGQQLKLLMPDDQTLEVQEFDAGLKDLLKETMSVNDLVSAWARGDTLKLNDLMNSGFKDNPKAEKTLFEDRNRLGFATGNHAERAARVLRHRGRRPSGGAERRARPAPPRRL